MVDDRPKESRGKSRGVSPQQSRGGLPRFRSRWRRWVVTAIVLMAIGGTTAWATAPRWLAAGGRWLDVGTTPQRADAAWILNGDLHSRPLEAALLYRNSTVPRIVVTSVRPIESLSDVNQTSRSERDEVIGILIAAGVDRGDIDVIDAKVTSTFDEAVAVGQWLADDPSRRVIVVTNDYHTRRTRWIFRQTLSNAQTRENTPPIDRVALVSARGEGFGASNWWRHQDGFNLYLAEYIKFAVYFVWYGVGRPIIGWWSSGVTIVAGAATISRPAAGAVIGMLMAAILAPVLYRTVVSWRGRRI